MKKRETSPRVIFYSKYRVTWRIRVYKFFLIPRRHGPWKRFQSAGITWCCSKRTSQSFESAYSSVGRQTEWRLLLVAHLCDIQLWNYWSCWPFFWCPDPYRLSGKDVKGMKHFTGPLLWPWPKWPSKLSRHFVFPWSMQPGHALEDGPFGPAYPTIWWKLSIHLGYSSQLNLELNSAG